MSTTKWVKKVARRSSWDLQETISLVDELRLVDKSEWDFSGMELNRRHLKMIASALKNLSLTLLSFRNCRLDNDMFSSFLRSSISSCKIQKFDISGNDLTDAALEDLLSNVVAGRIDIGTLSLDLTKNVSVSIQMDLEEHMHILDARPSDSSAGKPEESPEEKKEPEDLKREPPSADPLPPKEIPQAGPVRERKRGRANALSTHLLPPDIVNQTNIRFSVRRPDTLGSISYVHNGELHLGVVLVDERIRDKSTSEIVDNALSWVQYVENGCVLKEEQTSEGYGSVEFDDEEEEEEVSMEVIQQLSEIALGSVVGVDVHDLSVTKFFIRLECPPHSVPLVRQEIESMEVPGMATYVLDTEDGDDDSEGFVGVLAVAVNGVLRDRDVKEEFRKRSQLIESVEITDEESLMLDDEDVGSWQMKHTS